MALRMLKSIIKRLFSWLNLRILIFYVLFICLSSLSKYWSIFTNFLLVLIIYQLYKTNPRILKLLLNVFVISNYLIFQLFVYFYKEILSWELGLVLLFLFLYVYYSFYLNCKQDNMKIMINYDYNNNIIMPSDTKLLNCKM